ncbi:MAG: hypothetical protein Hals2KO_04190 [Halioglobus sp.]
MSQDPDQDAQAGSNDADVDAADSEQRLQALNAVVLALRERGEINDAQAQQLTYALPLEYERSRYVIKHFGVHLSIGAVFAFDIVPLPLGTIGRIGWVCCARVVETLRANFERARVHSLRVLLVAAIPYLGYFAYLLPLHKDGREVAFVLANEYWLANRGQSFEQFVRSRGRMGARLARWLVPLPWEHGQS